MSKQAPGSRKTSDFRPEGRPQTTEVDSILESAAAEFDDSDANPDDSDDGYDDDGGPLESGYASRSVALPSASERSELAEPGLSIDPEDLGRHFLQDAAQLETNGVDPLEPAELEESDTEAEGVAAGGLEDDGLDADEEVFAEPSTPRDVDLTQDDLKEGSLFDQPSGEGTRSPRVKTDELESTLDRNERARRFGTRPAR